MLIIADNEHAYGGCSISVWEGCLTFIYLIYSIIYLLSIIYIIYCIFMMSKRELNTGSTTEPLKTSLIIYLSKGKGTLVPLLISKFDGDRGVS